MFDLELFLGFPIDKLYQAELDQADGDILSFFIQPGQDYLQKVIHQNVSYLGKFAGKINEPQKLELLSTNIYSLLKKITPDYPCEETALTLFPVPSE